ncbi:MAG: signal recognition particle-docking protein FtsY [Alphaproteobacteria bacterium]|nr:signal recognition particle-docking protein FtsY [Alphaproteobacteria bacterium]
MVFWRKKKNQAAQEKEHHDDRLLHHEKDPALEPPTEYDPEMDEALQKELAETEIDIIDDLDLVPTPEHTLKSDLKEADDLSDHSNEGGWFSRLTKGLSKSSNKIGQSIGDVFTKRKLDDEALEELEDILITADIGSKVSAKLVAEISKEKFDKEVEQEEIQEALAAQIEEILTPVAQKLDIKKPEDGPFIMLVCGVNGAGKTTTIGKLAHEYHMKQHKKTMIAAGDTFRAAAVEQLEVWAARAHVPLLKKDIGADASAVAYEAIEKAREQGTELLMIDTAGRLQNKANLMAELEKMVRVIKKQDETAPHAVLLVLDATTGQNAHSQVEKFKELLDVTGLVVTKLDGSAKGGVVVALAEEFALPIYAVGVGEKIEDLSPFEAKDFARALVGLEG